jgi:hypothetical protein
MRVVTEFNVGEFELALALDINLVRAVDHDVGDGLVAQERLQRPETQHLIDDLVRKRLLFDVRERDFQLHHDIADELDDLAFQILARQARRRIDIDLLHEQRIDFILGVAVSSSATAACRFGGIGAGIGLRGYQRFAAMFAGSGAAAAAAGTAAAGAGGFCSAGLEGGGGGDLLHQRCRVSRTSIPL